VRALSLYARLVAVDMRAQLQYRASFLLDLVGTGLNTALWFAAISFLFARFEGLAGWTLGEVAFLYGLVEGAFGTMDLLFGGFDPAVFGQQVRRGTFDQLLLRPVNVGVQVLGSRFLLRRLGRIVQGLAILAVALAVLPVTWTPAKLIYLPVVFASLVCFFGGLFIAGAAVTFWTVESIEAINVLTYGGSEMISYPMHIYPDALRRFFTYVVPAIFLNYSPALFFLDKPDPLHLPPVAPFLAPVVGLATLVVALLFWRVGVRHYQSTGS
jgi:ABC-2 type transport system permease protein